MFVSSRTALFLIFFMVSSFLHAVSFSNHYLILIDTDGQFEIIGGLKKDRVDIPSHISPVTVYLSPDDQLQRVDQHELIKQQLLNEYVNFLRSHDFILRCKVSSKKLKNNTELLVSLFHDKIHLGSYKTRTRGDYDEPTMVFLSTDYLLDLSTLPASIVLPFPYYFIATNNLEFRKGLRFPVFYVNQVIADDNGDVVFQCSCQGENNCSIVHKVRDGICDEIHIATPEVKLKLKSYEQFDSDDKWKQTLAKTSSELQAVILHEQSHTGLKKAKKKTVKHSPLINFLKEKLAQGSEFVEWIDENEGEFQVTNMKELYRLWRGEKYDKTKPPDFFAKSLHSLVKKELLLKTGGWGCYQYKFTKSK